MIFAVFVIPLALCRIRSAHWIAAAVAIGYYWGRETCDHEGRLKLPAIDVWSYSWMPWEWSPKGIADLLWPIAAAILAALAVEFLLWRRRARGR